MPGRVLFCTRCGTGYGILNAIPPTCPSCEQTTTWTTSPLGPWLKPLTEFEKRFLKSLRIASED